MKLFSPYPKPKLTVRCRLIGMDSPVAAEAGQGRVINAYVALRRPGDAVVLVQELAGRRWPDEWMDSLVEAELTLGIWIFFGGECQGTRMRLQYLWRYQEDWVILEQGDTVGVG